METRTEGDDAAGSGGNRFRAAFKYYKRRRPPPDLGGVVEPGGGGVWQQWASAAAGNAGEGRPSDVCPVVQEKWLGQDFVAGQLWEGGQMEIKTLNYYFGFIITGEQSWALSIFLFFQ